MSMAGIDAQPLTAGIARARIGRPAPTGSISAVGLIALVLSALGEARVTSRPVPTGTRRTAAEDRPPAGSLSGSLLALPGAGA